MAGTRVTNLHVLQIERFSVFLFLFLFGTSQTRHFLTPTQQKMTKRAERELCRRCRRRQLFNCHHFPMKDFFFLFLKTHLHFIFYSTSVIMCLKVTRFIYALYFTIFFNLSFIPSLLMHRIMCEKMIICVLYTHTCA